MRVFRRRGNRIKPLLSIHCQWLCRDSTYPERLHVVMQDGRIVRYAVEMTATRIHAGKHGWETTGHEVIGYQYKERPIACARRKRSRQKK